MKNRIHLHLSLKHKISALAFIIFLAFSGFSFFLLSSDARAFQSFSNDFFISELSGNTLNMHYTIAEPSSYGISSYTPTLPSYSRERKAASLSELSHSMQLLGAIDSSRLNEKEAYTYRLLLPYLANEKNGMSLSYYASPVSPSSGMQSQLPILLAEYTFRSKRDVADYLSLIEQTDTYFGGIADYLAEQAEAGLFMAGYSADKVIEQCGKIIDKSSLESGSHFLISTFEERLNTLRSKGIISEKEKAAYIAENRRLLTTVMLPAYERLGDELLILREKGQNENGLYYFPKGREYYLYLIRSNTGSYRDIEAIKGLLFQDFNSNFDAMYTLVQNNPGLASPQRLPFSFKYDAPSDMLKNLQQMMSADFPALSEVAGEQALPVCTVKSISRNLEDYCSPAFYLTPPLDDIHENVIYINRKNNPAGAELYTTLAHEGYPGHLYQTVYSQLYFRKANVNPVRSLLSYGGYVEGWAMYVELMSYDYAKALMKETTPEAEAVYESYKLDRQIQLCLYSLLDIAIHYEGADYPKVHKLLASIGISNPSVTRAIYEYIVEEPATYIKYYLGYLEILELKKEAASLWGDAYSDCGFHRFYLENGPADFTNLRIQLENTKSSPAYRHS